MKFIFIIVVIVLVFKSLGKMLSGMKITDTSENPVSQRPVDKQNHIHVSEDDIEDADFKDVE